MHDELRKLAEGVAGSPAAALLSRDLASGVLSLLDELRAATDMLVAAEKFVPGVIQTAGRFALGDVAEARAELAATRTALGEAAEALEERHYAWPDTTEYDGAVDLVSKALANPVTASALDDRRKAGTA